MVLIKAEASKSANFNKYTVCFEEEFNETERSAIEIKTRRMQALARELVEEQIALDAKKVV